MSGRARGPSLSSAGVPKAEALALRLEDMPAVREAIEGGSGKPFAAEHFRPLSKGKFAVTIRLCR